MHPNLINLIRSGLIIFLMITSCTIKVKVSASIPLPPPEFVNMTQLLIDSGLGLSNGVTSITNPSGGSYQIAYNSSALFYTPNNPISANTNWNIFATNIFGGANIIATSPYYTANNIPQLLVLTNNNATSITQLWICSNLNNAGMNCTQDIGAIPSTLPLQGLTSILGNGGVSYAILNNNLLLMSLSGDHYLIMPNIPALPINTGIISATTDIFGNLYVVFNSSAIGPVLYEFNINKQEWSLILQNALLSNGVIAVDANHNIYFIDTTNGNGSCVNNNANFNIQYVRSNILITQRMSFNGCKSPMNIQNINVDANNQVYVSLQNGNISQVYYSNGPVIY